MEPTELAYHPYCQQDGSGHAEPAPHRGPDQRADRISGEPEVRGVQGGSSNERSEAAADPLARSRSLEEGARRRRVRGVQGGSSNERSEAAADPLARSRSLEEGARRR